MSSGAVYFNIGCCDDRWIQAIVTDRLNDDVVATFRRHRLFVLPLLLMGGGITVHGLLWVIADEPWLLDRGANELLLRSSYESLLAAPPNHHLADYLTGLYRFFGWWLAMLGLLVLTYLRGADLRRRRARRAILAALFVALVGVLWLQARFIPTSPFVLTGAAMALAWLVSAAASFTWSRDEREVWDELASGYDRSIRLFDRPYASVREHLRRDLAGAGRVLEVAAGTGLFTGSLSAAVGRLVATDFSWEMVSELRLRVQREGLSNVETAVEDAGALSFPDASFDALVCANALHVMPHPERALAEMRRVLVPGGQLLVPTFGHGATPGARCISRLLALVSRFRSYRRFEAASIERLVEQAGFSVTAVETFPGPLPVLYVRAHATAA